MTGMTGMTGMALTDRQTQFADAALQILADEGLTAVSFRNVAAAAGMSVGAVQKAFAGKDEMLRAMVTRLRTVAAGPHMATPGRPTLRAWLTDLTLAILPLDEARRARQLMADGLGGRAVHDPGLADALAAGDADLLGAITALVRRAQHEGEVPRDVDAERAARFWLTHVTGMTHLLIRSPLGDGDARPEVEALIALMLSPTPLTGRSTG